MDDGHSRQFDTVLFDLDGVITGEYTYWKTAALTVYEYFYEDQELNCEYCYDNAEAISDRVFSYQKTITTLKSLGINSNWDLAYAVIMATDILKSEGWEEEDVFCRISEFMEEKNVLAPELLDVLAEEYEALFHYPEGYAKKGGEFYQEIVRKFQHWYLGDAAYSVAYGEAVQSPKGDRGLMDREEPLLGLEKTRALLSYLKDKGYCLGIGSGRPDVELYRPLDNWGVLPLFQEERIVGYDAVLEWQTVYHNRTGSQEPLVKPHPFQYIKGAMGKEFTLDHLASHPDFRRVLVVGDALCDLMAAKAAGCRFCAVLTGVDGKDARGFFEQMGADFILDDATCLTDIL